MDSSKVKDLVRVTKRKIKRRPKIKILPIDNTWKDYIKMFSKTNNSVESPEAIDLTYSSNSAQSISILHGTVNAGKY